MNISQAKQGFVNEFCNIASRFSVYEDGWVVSSLTSLLATYLLII
jgi:hypothetical protein